MHEAAYVGFNTPHAAVSVQEVAVKDGSCPPASSALRSYGIASGSFRLTDAARNVARDPDVLDAEVDKWVTLSFRLDDNRAAFAVGHGERQDLAREAQQLRDLQARRRRLRSIGCRHPRPNRRSSGSSSYAARSAHGGRSSRRHGSRPSGSTRYSRCTAARSHRTHRR